MPETALSAVVSAYSVYPQPKSAEAVVNAALIDALRFRLRVGLVTSRHGYQPLMEGAPGQNHTVQVFADRRVASPRTVLERFADWLAYPKWHPCGAAARIADRLRLGVGRASPLSTAAYGERAAAHLSSWLESDFRGAVVWARGTPPESFEAAIAAFRHRPFPLVVNYNDPMPQCLLWGATYGGLNPAHDAFQHRQNRFLAANAQAWTFPSSRLADLMASAAGLERNRCFVIPHLVPSAEPTPPREPALSGGPWLVYAGTFYPAVFTDEVRAGIGRYAQSGGKVRLLFVLKQPPADVLRWIDQAVTGSRVLSNLQPTEATALIERAQSVLVADSARHGVLLRTKVVEAVRSNRAILALAAPGTTTHDVIAAAGGLAVNPTTAERVEEGLRRLEQLLGDEEQLQALRAAQQRVAARFSAERVVQDSIAVLEYARRRFDWWQSRHGAEPEPPLIERWP